MSKIRFSLFISQLFLTNFTKYFNVVGTQKQISVFISLQHFFYNNFPKQFRHFFCFIYINKMISNEQQKMTKTKPQKMPKFYCKFCDFRSSKKSNFMKHLDTPKHQRNIVIPPCNKKKPENETFKQPQQPRCMKCGEIFGSKTTLWRHKKKCRLEIAKTNEKIKSYWCEQCKYICHNRTTLWRHKKKCGKTDSNNDINFKIEENTKIVEDKKVGLTKVEEQLLELLPKLTDALTKMAERPTNINCNNKMTINMYLNEECKNAMNLTDFVDKVNVSLDDLMYTQQHGYVKGISNIFLKNLTDMDPKERPIHCSDKKRMQFYIKEEDKWEKDKKHIKIDNSIAKITHKQILKIREWEDKHPNFLENDELTHIWQKMCAETMGGAKDTWEELKILNVIKIVLILKKKYQM